MTGSRTFRHRITFQKPTATTDDSGQVLRTWADEFKRRANVEQIGGSKGRNDQLVVDADFRITLPHDRRFDDVSVATWRVIWEDSGQTINIKSLANDYTGRRVMVEIIGSLDRETT